LTVLDDKLVPKVREIINLYGVPAYYLETPLNVYDPTTGKSLVGDNTRIPLTVSPPGRFSRQINDSILIDDMGIYILPDLVPKPGNRIEVNTITYNIVMVFPLYTGLLIAAYKLQLRK